MRLRSLVRVVSLVPLCLTPSCLDRPVGVLQPRTTNVLVDVLLRNTPTKIDLLFMIDNSQSMADKQVLFAEALPDLVSGLVAPPCIQADGSVLNVPPSERCPSGSTREFEPVEDIHIGVVTSSLGSYTAEGNCIDDGVTNAEQNLDAARLLGALPRGAAVAPSAQNGFLAWRPQQDNSPLIDEFRGLVQAAGEHGCGWEASLESWYRFLIDPQPYRELVRSPCGSTDSSNLCIAPAVDPVTGAVLVDEEILAQRKAFLRPDSLVAIVMLTDENDCSFRASGLTRNFAEARDAEGFGTAAFRASAACEDPAFGPNSECCDVCAHQAAEGCPTALNAKGNTVALGCEEGTRFPLGDVQDDPNLRCFDQKKRFGIDLLYPVARYSNALKQDTLCTLADDLDPLSQRCAGGIGLLPNPLFEVPVAVEHPMLPRPKSFVYLAGIVGVPWQDLALSADSDNTLEYRSSDPKVAESERIDWRWVLGQRNGSAGPLDPLMIESIEPRQGTNPATGEAVGPTDGDYAANSINGHEWLVQAGDPKERRGDLQYACVFPLEHPVTCRTDAELRDLDPNEAAKIPDCDCTYYGVDGYKNPLCQGTNQAYGLQQTRAKAYPGIRELQVLEDFGANSVVASICPKTTDSKAPDYGYRPAMAAIIARLKEGLVDQCFQRELDVDPEAGVSCLIVEARIPEPGDPGGCDTPTRSRVSDELDRSVRNKLLALQDCPDAEACAQLQLCAIDQLLPGADEAALNSCLNEDIPVGDGWCYVDPAIQGNPKLVEKCPKTSQRKVRFVGEATPRPGTFTVFSCSGAAFEDR
jgi:hypothetical protein